MRYRITVQEGRRAISYEVDAASEDEAKEKYIKWLSFLGALTVNEIDVKEEPSA